MKSIRRKFSAQWTDDFIPHSTVKIIKNGLEKVQKPASPKVKPATKNRNKSPAVGEYRENDMRIQMLSSSLFQQIFHGRTSTESKNCERWIDELKRHGIKVGESVALRDVNIKLPPLRGSNIEEHFQSISEEQSGPYKTLIETLLPDIPERPKQWSFTPGWTKYSKKGPQRVDCPEGNAFIFDTEVCMSEGQAPTMACAVSKDYWYSWTSSSLVNVGHTRDENQKYTTDDFIQFEDPGSTKCPKVIIGHNVSYDRARIREQYFIDATSTRFVDTMSLHVCISGVTSYQRAMLKSNKELSEEDELWSAQSSLNSLGAVFQLYCGKELTKDRRDVFVNGTLDDVRQDFQNLMDYCSSDVHATHAILQKLYPLFIERFPHAATLAGMLEIGSAYLPINSNWNRYISESQLSYEDLDIEAKYLLARRADQACRLAHNQEYKKDIWLWDQDWSTQELKLKKDTVRKAKNITTEATTSPEVKLKEMIEMKRLLPVRRPLLPGYPAWYRKLCEKPGKTGNKWVPGPHGIGTGMQIAPKLLSLCWEGYPLHYIREQGWGFIVPLKKERSPTESGDIPLSELVARCPVIESGVQATLNESEEALSMLWKDVETNLSKKDYYTKKKKTKSKLEGLYKGAGVWCNTVLENCCWFLKLPHKNGPSNRVGNPLAKDFLNKFSENVLSGEGKTAERVIEIAKMLSYWRNNRDRIMGQLTVWMKKTQLPLHLRESDTEFGAIIPQVVVSGTLTRRAMESTWMTASNAQRERVGSELRAMVQAPPGYRIVGADVDSQELWIASVLGDAYAAGIHGATPFGWMTLSGTKSNGTDMHSVTAKAVGISRDHAKVINYARIYGAGENFAGGLLKQFNPTISIEEAKSKARKMFALTKGKRYYHLLPEFSGDLDDRGYTGYEALKVAAAMRKGVNEVFHKSKWIGGTESAMFNRLEEIATASHPVTPFLAGQLSRALEPTGNGDDRFLPTRVNWVVQSGAVDFLHLMLVCMRWLMDSNIRFCLSFHDEVRYLVKEEYAYRAALALHLTNLLTRSFCSHRIGLTDLPQSVAFFTSVEVDRVLRKEAQQDCRTPSNPHGLTAGYGIPDGESLDVYQTIEKAGGGDLTQWEWHTNTEVKN